MGGDGVFSITPRERWTYASFASGALASVVLLQMLGHGDLFAAYLGDWNPLLLQIAAVAAGLIALLVLQPHGFAIWAPGGIRPAVAAATALAAVVIAVDLAAGVGAHTVPWPWSLPFYLGMAFLVEVGFHLAPLALLLSLSALFACRRQNQRVWISIVAVSMLEPFYQAAMGPHARLWLVAFVWLQVWAVNLAQLFAFRKFGFASMIALRLTYYAFWHILWGSAQALR